MSWIDMYRNVEFESSSELTEQFHNFSLVFRDWWKRLFHEAGIGSYSISRGHFEMSLFFEFQGQWWYVNTGDLRTKFGGDVLIRTCDGPKDYTGGLNQWIHMNSDVMSQIRQITGILAAAPEEEIDGGGKRIDRARALYYLRYPDALPPNQVLMSFEYGQDDGGPDDELCWSEVLPEDLDTIQGDLSYAHFELWPHVHNDDEVVELTSRQCERIDVFEAMVEEMVAEALCVDVPVIENPKYDAWHGFIHSLMDQIAEFGEEHMGVPEQTTYPSVLAPRVIGRSASESWVSPSTISEEESEFPF